jgi:telomerase Cajal body protein 1
MWTLDPKGSIFPVARYHRGLESCAPTSAFPNSDFWKLCKWSPQGTHLFAAQDDDVIQIIQLPSVAVERALGDEQGSFDDVCPLVPSIRIKVGESIYDAKWYSACDFCDPQTACFAASCRGKPVVLWDAMSGKTRCTYRTYDHMDEIASAKCLCFHPDGERLAAGVRDDIVLWRLNCPGRDYETIPTRETLGDRRGVVSALAIPPSGDLVATGFYDGSVHEYDLRSGVAVNTYLSHRGGVLHIDYSKCGNYIYSRARHDNHMCCWDARNSSSCIYTLLVPGKVTNQRLEFDIEPCGRHLLAGTTDGELVSFDLVNGEMQKAWRVARDTVAGVSINPFVGLVAIGSGHRRFWEEGEEWVENGCNELAMWAMP